jgi:hypothetical protein
VHIINDKPIHWKVIINGIVSFVYLSGSKTNKTSARDIREFTILKCFMVNLHPPKAPQIKEVFWFPPSFNWIKVNTDGAATKNPLNASAGGIFRDRNGVCIGCYAKNLGTGNAFCSELVLPCWLWKSLKERLHFFMA